MKKIDVIISSVIMIGAFLWMLMSAIRLGDTGAIGIFIFLALVALVPLIGMFALMIGFIRVFIFGGSDDWKIFSDEDDAQEQEDEKDEDEEREEENETSTYYLNENDKRFFTNNWINGKRMSQAKYLFVTNNFSSNLIDNFFSYEDEEGIEGILEILYRYGVKDIAKMSMSQYRYQEKENREIDCVVFIHTGGNSEDISNVISYIKTHEFKTKTIVLILNNSNKVKRTMEKVGADSILIYDAQVKNKNYLSDITTWFVDIVDKEHPHIYSKEQRSNPLKKTFRCKLCGGIRWKKEDDGYVCKDCNCFYSPKEMKKLLLTDRDDNEDMDLEDEQIENLPFDIEHFPELVFATKTRFCDKFPDKTANQNIRLTNKETGRLTQNLSEECWIVDDYLIQFVINAEQEVFAYYVNIVNKEWGSKKVQDFTSEEKIWFYNGIGKYSNEIRRQFENSKDEKWKKILNCYTIVLYATINETRLNEQAVKQLEYSFERRYKETGEWYDLSGNYTAWGRIGNGILRAMGISIATNDTHNILESRDVIRNNKNNINDVYVEAVLMPGTRDFGFFDVFLDLEKEDELKEGKNKQKSIIMSKDAMYVCQYVQSPYGSGETELISKMEWKTGNVYKYLGDVPTTTRYRLATEELWIFLMIAMSKMGKSYMDVVADRLEESNDVDLYYNERCNSVCKSDGSVASWSEIVLGLSHELRTR